MLDPALVDKALAGDGKAAEEARLSAVESASVSDVLLAADTARIGLEKGSTDVRLLTAYELGVFVEQGPKSLAGIFDSLRKAVSERWHSLRPEERKGKVVDGASSRLFRSMVNHIDVHEKMQDATFKAWLRSSDHDSVGDPALRASSALREALVAAIGEPLCTAPLSEVDARIRSYFDRFPSPQPAPRREPAAEPEPRPEEEKASSGAADASHAPGEASQSAAETQAGKGSGAGGDSGATSDAGGRPSPSRATIAVSPAFALLLKKIDSVGQLLQEGDSERAAVVADDIRRTLDKFDPRVFFPEQLLPYFQLLSRHIDDIAPEWDKIGSPRWEALSQLYSVDLDSFVHGERS